MSNLVYSKFRLSQNFLKSHFKLSAFQLNLLLLSQISMSQNFGFHEITFQSLIYKSIQILFAMSKLSIKSITKPVNNMAIRSIVFIDKLGLKKKYMFNKVTTFDKMVEITGYKKISYTVEPVYSDTPRDQGNVANCT